MPLIRLRPSLTQIKRIAFYISSCLTVCLLIACGKRLGGLTKPPPAQMTIFDQPPLNKVFAYHGELVRVDSLRFRKTTILYAPSGQIEQTSVQVHVVYPASFSGGWIHLAPESSGLLPPEGQLGTTRVRYSPAAVSSTRGNTDSSELRDAARAAFFTATLPWRLRDTSVQLTRVGVDEDAFGDARHVVALAADYGTDPKAEPWIHYFDSSSGRHLGYFVDHGGDDALVVNDRDTLVSGLRLAAERLSYRVVDGKRQYLRARFTYRYE